MEPVTTAHDAVHRDESPVHDWRLARPGRLGISGPQAGIYAGRSHWNQIARLVLEAETMQLLDCLDQLDPEHSDWLREIRNSGRTTTAASPARGPVNVRG